MLIFSLMSQLTVLNCSVSGSDQTERWQLYLIHLKGTYHAHFYVHTFTMGFEHFYKL